MRLTANGVTQTATFRVEKDPRLTDVTQADLDEQFKLASQIRDRVSEADEMVIKIRATKKDLKDHSAASERLEAKLTAIEEDLYQVRNRSGQDPLNFPIKLNNQLAALERSISTGDARPTDQSYVVYKELNERLDALKARLAEAMAGK